MNSKIAPNFLFTACIVFLFLCSCNSREKSNKYPEKLQIDMDDSIFGNVDVVIEEVIPLETKQNCLIGDVLNLKHFNNHFYIIDYIQSKTVFAFNRRGELIKKLDNGKGPGEVIQPIAFAINRNDSTILVHDPFQQRNLIYNLDLEYIGSKDFMNQSILGIHEINGDTLLLYEYREIRNMNEKRNRIYSLFLKNSDKSIPFNIFENPNKTATSIINNVSIYKDTVLFICPYSYIIYELHKGSPLERYKLEFGKYGYSAEELETLSSNELLKLALKGQKVGSIECIFNTEDFLVIRPIITKNPVYIFKSKRTNKVIFLNRYFSTLLPECIIYDSFNDNRFIAIVEPETFKNFIRTKEGFSGIDVKLSDNPVIIIFKIIEKY